MSGIKNIFGGGAISVEGERFGDVEILQKAFDILEKGNVHTIDTAAVYGQSQQILGQVDAGKRFTIDTKIPGGVSPGRAGRSSVLEDIANNQKLLKHPVDILYIHAPDASTPLEETCAAINEAYQTGFFKRFGLSNYVAEDVQKVYDICKTKGYVLPSVYQGNYSAIARKQETVLFPTLRKLGISFYAYSPIAGGFLAKSREQLEQGHGRFQRGNFLGDMYYELYHKPSLLEALDEWAKIADEEGVTKSDLAYRWVKYNSPLKEEFGDGIIIGARDLEQLEENLKAINNGPLSGKAAQRIDEIWKKVEGDAPLDNFNLPDGSTRSFSVLQK